MGRKARDFAVGGLACEPFVIETYFRHGLIIT